MAKKRKKPSKNVYFETRCRPGEWGFEGLDLGSMYLIVHLSAENTGILSGLEPGSPDP